MKKLTGFHTIFTTMLVMCLISACTPPAEPTPRPTMPVPSPVSGIEIVMAAPADLELALKEMAAAYEAKSGNKVSLIFGTTEQLKAGLEKGAHYNILLTSDTGWLDELSTKDLVDSKSISAYVYSQGTANQLREYKLAILSQAEHTLVALNFMMWLRSPASETLLHNYGFLTPADFVTPQP